MFFLSEYISFSNVLDKIIFLKVLYMIKRLTHKKVLVDSAYRLPQSRSSSDFIIELDENMECPNGTKLFITEVSIPAVWKTTEVGFYEKLYFMLYKNGSLFGNYIIDLSNKIYFAEQLSFDIVQKMNEATNGEQTDMFFMLTVPPQER